MRALAEIARLRTGPCRSAGEAITQIAAGEPADPAQSEHVEVCLRCQAEVAAYRRLLRQLRALRHEGIPAPPEGVVAVLAALEAAAAGQHPGSSTWALRAAYVGGITMATAAAGAAGVLVWMNRKRPRLADAG